jgi:hypothetical protein
VKEAKEKIGDFLGERKKVMAALIFTCNYAGLTGKIVIPKGDSQ